MKHPDCSRFSLAQLLSKAIVIGTLADQAAAAKDENADQVLFLKATALFLQKK